MTENPMPPIRSAEHGAEFRRRILAEAARQHLGDRKHGPLIREQIIQALATAAIGVAYPQIWAERDAPLTAAERQFLTFALDLAADEMASRGDEFSDEDDAALETLRRMAVPPGESSCS